jgi:hypothetical protein
MTSTDITFSRGAAAERACTVPATPKQDFNGDGVGVSYLKNVRTTKETTMKLTVIASRSEFAIDHDEWISCSHWGMFPVPRKTSNSRGEA